MIGLLIAVGSALGLEIGSGLLASPAVPMAMDAAKAASQWVKDNPPTPWPDLEEQMIEQHGNESMKRSREEWF